MLITLRTSTAEKFYEGLRQYNNASAFPESTGTPIVIAKCLTITIEPERTSLAFNPEFVDKAAELIIDTIEEIAPLVMMGMKLFKRLKKTWVKFIDSWEGEGEAIATTEKAMVPGEMSPEKMMAFLKEQLPKEK